MIVHCDSVNTEIIQAKGVVALKLSHKYYVFEAKSTKGL